MRAVRGVLTSRRIGRRAHQARQRMCSGVRARACRWNACECTFAAGMPVPAASELCTPRDSPSAPLATATPWYPTVTVWQRAGNTVLNQMQVSQPMRSSRVCQQVLVNRLLVTNTNFGQDAYWHSHQLLSTSRQGWQSESRPRSGVHHVGGKTLWLACTACSQCQIAGDSTRTTPHIKKLMYEYAETIQFVMPYPAVRPQSAMHGRQISGLLMGGA
jgi:hypothetical protein